MGSNIYTRNGDKGETSLVGGGRIAKVALRVEAYGTVDESTSWVGAARAFTDDALLNKCLAFLQQRLYNCSSNLATHPDSEFKPPAIDAGDIDFLERAIDRFEEQTGSLTNFVVPGGGRTAGLLHVSRTVMRRAERRIVHLAQKEKVDPDVLGFVNRASDFLFAAARYANRIESAGDEGPGADVIWNPDLPIPEL